jgi:hypothetical protein
VGFQEVCNRALSVVLMERTLLRAAKEKDRAYSVMRGEGYSILCYALQRRRIEIELRFSVLQKWIMGLTVIHRAVMCGTVRGALQAHPFSFKTSTLTEELRLHPCTGTQSTPGLSHLEHPLLFSAPPDIPFFFRNPKSNHHQAPPSHLGNFDLHTDWVNDVAVCEDVDFLISASSDSSLKVRMPRVFLARPIPTQHIHH